MLSTARSLAGRLTLTPIRWLTAVLRWALMLLLLLWGLMLLAWLVLHWAILPHINDWRPQLERMASQGLGLELRIGRIAVRSGGWIPALELDEVRLHDAGGREALRLPRVVAALSARSMLALELRFEQLLIESPQLEIRRDAQGRIFVAGLDMGAGGDAASGDALADWFFAQHEFVIRRGRLRWVDEARQAPPLELAELDLLMRNGLRRHELRLDASPPPAWGQRFSLRGRFSQSLLRRPGELRHWSGQLYAELPRADVRELRRYLDLPFELSEGDGALRAWLDIGKGQAQGATLDLGLRAVRLRLGAGMEALDLARIEGRLALQRQPGGYKLSASQLGFEGADGLVWPRSDWSVQIREAAGSAGGGELQAQQLDLALMAQIASRLPLAESQRQLLDELAPQGQVRNLQARWSGAIAAPASYRVKASLSDLSLRAKPAAVAEEIGRPGLAGAAIELEASERGGAARLRLAQGQLDFPGVFEEPQLPFEQLQAQLDWRIDARAGQLPLVELKVSDARLVSPDVSGELQAVWRTGQGSDAAPGRGKRFPGQLDMSGRLERADAVRVVRYLPLGIGQDARDYVRHAVRSGEARNISFRVRGDLWDFPFDRSPQGQFRIAARAEGVELAYVPSWPATATEPAWNSPWPMMDRVSADLIFDRGAMQIRNGRARVMGYELSQVNGGIADLINKQVLALEGQGRGGLGELLGFVRASPVGAWIGAGLAQAQGSGPASLRLSLQIPLADVDQATVKGQVQLLGNELRLQPELPLFSNARARIEFDRKHFSLQAGSARILGGEATFDGASQRDGSLRFSGQGQITAEALRRAGELGLPARLARSLSGQTAYRLQLAIKEGGASEINLSSTLQGLGLDLPAPLRKEAEAQLPLRLQTSLAAGGGRDELRLELGSVLQARYLRDTSGATPRVLSGALALQDSLPPLPAQGVRLQANPATLDLDAWQLAAQHLLGEGGAGVIEGGGYAPDVIALRAQSLRLGGRALNQLVAGLSREGGLWRATLEAQQLSGYLQYRPGQGALPGQLYARLARLSLPKSEADSVSQLLSEPAAGSGSVPALDIVVDDFELRGKRLGRLEVEALAQARDWRLKRLSLKHPDALLSASGEWLAEAQGRRRTEFDWKLEVADAGNLLERLGQGRVLRGGKGQLAGQLGWTGSPLSPDYPSMSGKLTIALDAGQFLQAEPGVARLLGVLSLQSLPRRLLLDFRDVFSEGFAFDGFGGDVSIERGVASSQNLRMNGLQAAVLMEGSTDLARETQQLRVLVVPEINAGGASLAYAAINPAVGLGTFLAQLLLRKPMMAANTREFLVSGSWSDPKVERVERKPTAEAPAASDSRN